MVAVVASASVRGVSLPARIGAFLVGRFEFSRPSGLQILLELGSQSSVKHRALS